MYVLESDTINKSVPIPTKFSPSPFRPHEIFFIPIPSPQKIPHPHSHSRVNFPVAIPIPIPPQNLKSGPIYRPRHVMKTYDVYCMYYRNQYHFDREVNKVKGKRTLAYLEIRRGRGGSRGPFQGNARIGDESALECVSMTLRYTNRRPLSLPLPFYFMCTFNKSVQSKHQNEH